MVTWSSGVTFKAFSAWRPSVKIFTPKKAPPSFQELVCNVLFLILKYRLKISQNNQIINYKTCDFASRAVNAAKLSHILKRFGAPFTSPLGIAGVTVPTLHHWLEARQGEAKREDLGRATGSCFWPLKECPAQRPNFHPRRVLQHFQGYLCKWFIDIKKGVAECA